MPLWSSLSGSPFVLIYCTIYVHRSPKSSHLTVCCVFFCLFFLSTAECVDLGYGSSPAEAVHLTALKMEKEVGSSDDQESKPSNGDDKEEKGLGDGDDEDDDDNDKPNKMIK
ncbi:hypothetical protein XENORESO_008488 [Xenotaenia resolanae]|uniref:Uncharacterized protein n=1 Tax=Xenotaenia resolanae TaxID=208358 RepID=A0ABV0WRR5_9TELE